MSKKWIVVALILIWFAWQKIDPINFVGADLGRHIKSGELLLQGVTDILYKNYYSYTNPDYSFVNHHWFFGVICFIIWRYFDFFGLSLGFLFVQLATFLIFLLIANRYSSFLLSCAIALLSFPLIIPRHEIRPEGISLLLMGLFWLLLIKFQDQQLKAKHLKIILSLLQVIWVNTHIFFFMGPLMVGLFWLQSRLNSPKKWAQDLKQMFWLTLGACLINPSGFWGAITPFNLLKGFALDLTENQSIFVILQEFPHDKFAWYFIFTMVLMLIPWIFLLKKEGFKKNLFMLGLLVLVSFCAFKAVRLTGVYGLYWIPLTAYAWGKCLQNWSKVIQERIVGVFLISGILLSAFFSFNWLHDPALGLSPGVNDSAEFFKKNHIEGPIYNSYEIGGYLIFHLSPVHQLFTDNRQEANSSEFFKDTYLPMTFNEQVWHQKEEQYQFNVIYLFGRTANRQFLSHRYHDPTWALVYLDRYAVIFLKRNLKNAELIRKYEIKGFHSNQP